MPDVKLNGPRIKDLETKRTLVKEITDAMEKAYQLPREAYVIIINENEPENISIGGILSSDRKKG